MFKLVLPNEARPIYEEADAPLARKLANCFARIEADPRGGNSVKPLKGPRAGYWRYRAGDYRIVHSIDDAARLVHVITIAHRRDAYD